MSGQIDNIAMFNDSVARLDEYNATSTQPSVSTYRKHQSTWLTDAFLTQYQNVSEHPNQLTTRDNSVHTQTTSHVTAKTQTTSKYAVESQSAVELASKATAGVVSDSQMTNGFPEQLQTTASFKVHWQTTTEIVNTSFPIFYDNETSTDPSLGVFDNDPLLEEFPNGTVILSDGSKFFYNDTTTVIVTIVLPLLLALGVLTNSSFIFVVSRIRRLWTPTGFYLTNLACADLIYLCIVVSDKLIRYMSSPFSADYSAWGPNGCKIVTAAIFVPHYVSELTITLFTFERYQALKHPFKTSGQSKKRCLFLIFLTWCIATVLAIPCLMIIDGRNFFLIWVNEVANITGMTDSMPTHILKCGVPPIAFAGGVTLQCHALQTIPFFFSAIAMVVFNIMIIRALNKNTRIVKHMTKSSKSLEDKRQIVYMLVATSVVFYICLFPYYLDDIINVIARLQGVEPYVLPKTFLQIGRFMAYTNSAINPIIYNILSSRYRRACLRALCCCIESAVRDDSRMSIYGTTSGSRYGGPERDNSKKVGADDRKHHNGSPYPKYKFGIKDSDGTNEKNEIATISRIFLENLAFDNMAMVHDDYFLTKQYASNQVVGRTRTDVPKEISTKKYSVADTYI